MKNVNKKEEKTFNKKQCRCCDDRVEKQKWYKQPIEKNNWKFYTKEALKIFVSKQI